MIKWALNCLTIPPAMNFFWALTSRWCKEYARMEHDPKWRIIRYCYEALETWAFEKVWWSSFFKYETQYTSDHHHLLHCIAFKWIDFQKTRYKLVPAMGTELNWTELNWAQLSWQENFEAFASRIFLLISSDSITTKTPPPPS